MYHLFYSLLPVAAALVWWQAFPGPQSSPLRQVYQFPNATWVENIAVRSNGNLLVTLVNVPELWEIVSPQQPGKTRAQFIHRFQDTGMATGITEIDPDVYVVLTPNRVWRVDMNIDERATRAKLISNIDNAGSLNGMTLLNQEAGIVAIADCQLGLVWRLNTTDGSHSVMLQDESMAANKDIGPLLGINGLRKHQDFIYYVNTPRALYGRVRVDMITGHAIGPYETISTGFRADDFAISPGGIGYLAGITDNTIVRAFLNGKQEVVAGGLGSKPVVRPTSAAFGRNEYSNILYITTGGNAGSLTSFTGRGEILALKVDALGE
ncbi:hypothetical protein NW762_006509 [Fusarium torreyae]|uniref:SMP-30/Gluconolactonase/LRE-like region domain-containing protein n=1 Tax=Fusarium torreyae TaxID=1237075 RepID=A0A9W8VEW8_9HYPO|nr:hypothetical protein NW762_006509 [Fusarium torreyae]